MSHGARLVPVNRSIRWVCPLSELVEGSAVVTATVRGNGGYGRTAVGEFGSLGWSLPAASNARNTCQHESKDSR